MKVVKFQDSMSRPAFKNAVINFKHPDLHYELICFQFILIAMLSYLNNYNFLSIEDKYA